MCTKNEKCFTFLRTAASLEDISAFNVALKLWCNHWAHRQYKSDQTKEEFSALFDVKLNEIILTIRHQSMPVKFARIIMEFVKMIRKEIDKWIFVEYPPLCHWWPAFSNFPTFVMFSNLNEVAWYYDNLTIDHEKTAKNMLKNEDDVFDDKQLFAIACTYFLVDDIPQMSRSFGCTGTISAFWIDLYQHPHLLFDEYNFVNIMPIINSIRSKSASCECEHDQLTGAISEDDQSNFQYCWDQLNTYSRSEVIIYLIRNRLRFLLEFVLENLSQDQWIELVSRIGGFMIANLIKFYHDFDFIMQLWAHVKDTFSQYQFVYVMNYNFADDGKVLSCDDEECLHTSLWITAPDYLKKSTIDQFLKSERLIKCKGFLRAILKLANDQQKEKFLLKNHVQLIGHYSTADFSAIFHAYFDRNLITSVKKYLRTEDHTMTEMCLWRFLKSLEEVDSFLAWLETDISQTIELKRKVLEKCISQSTSKVILGFPHCLEDCKKLDNFICEAFPQLDHATEFKFEFISLLSQGKIFPPGIFHSPSALSSMPKFVESFFPSSVARLIEIKHNFVLQFGAFVEAGYFSGVDPRHVEMMNEFLTWCLDNWPESIFHFKKSLDFGTVFYNMTCGTCCIHPQVDSNYILQLFRIPRQYSTKSVLLALSYFTLVKRQQGSPDVSNTSHFTSLRSSNLFRNVKSCIIS